MATTTAAPSAIIAYRAVQTVTGLVSGITHWNEMLSAPYKIARPRQLYLGPNKRDYIDMSAR